MSASVRRGGGEDEVVALVFVIFLRKEGLAFGAGELSSARPESESESESESEFESDSTS